MVHTSPTQDKSKCAREGWNAILAHHPTEKPPKTLGPGRCSRFPYFGVVPGEEPDFYAPRASEGVVSDMNKKCAHERCSNRPSHGVAGTKIAEHCAQHAIKGMVKIQREKYRCFHQGCSTFGNFHIEGNTSQKYCAAHAKEGMVRSQHLKTCADNGCSKQPSFGFSGTREARYCSQHAAPGMVDVLSLTCAREGCSTWPSFGVPGTPRNTRVCAKHASAQMVNLRSKRCLHQGCVTQPSYSTQGSKKPEYCSQHASPGMVNVKRATCNTEGCSIMPSYAASQGSKAQSCSKHAGQGWVNVMTGMCMHEGCPNKRLYGVSGSKKAEVCSEHATEGMVKVKRRGRRPGSRSSKPPMSPLTERGNSRGTCKGPELVYWRSSGPPCVENSIGNTRPPEIARIGISALPVCGDPPGRLDAVSTVPEVRVKCDDEATQSSPNVGNKRRRTLPAVAFGASSLVRGDDGGVNAWTVALRVDSSHGGSTGPVLMEPQRGAEGTLLPAQNTAFKLELVTPPPPC